MSPLAPHPPILAHAAELLSGYDVMFCDVWGVLHDGHRAFEAACDALLRFKAGGGTVILVSNAPVPGERRRRHARFPRGAARVPTTPSSPRARSRCATSPSRATRASTASAPPIATPPDVQRGSTAERVGLEDAEAILCTGLNDDRSETADDYRPLLEQARARQSAVRLRQPRSRRRRRRQAVSSAPAPSPISTSAWTAACSGPANRTPTPTRRPVPRPKGCAAARVPLERIIAIGDSLRTDLKGAEAAGIAAIFVASGIHREETMGASVAVGRQAAPAVRTAGAPAPSR